jgi:formate--tetrahydrofolate ligase
MGKSDIEIAHEAKLQPIPTIGETLGLKESDLEVYGRYKAKLTTETIARLRARPDGALVLVTAIFPRRPARESPPRRSACDARRIGKVDCGHPRALVGTVLRDEGGGGGRRVCPGHADGGHQPSLHRAFHAVTSAHSLRAAMLDNHTSGQRPGLRRAAPRGAGGRHERSRLRNIVMGSADRRRGAPRVRLEITVASEIMAVLAWPAISADLKTRLAR